jgi:type IV pilus assembly protein PilV
VVRLSTRGAERGVSLIEVMVAILVFSIGMLGLALLQMKGAKFTRESASRTSAIILARSLAESMRANPDGALPKTGDSAYLYDGDTTYTQAQCDSTSLASPQAIATRDLACWQIALKRTIPLPTGSGSKLATVTKDATLGTLTITVSWAGVADDATADATQSYSFSYLQ